MFVLFLILPLISLPPISYAEKSQIKIGVIAYRGHDEAVKSWTPTAQYLSREMPKYSFSIVPLGLTEIGKRVKKGDLDFVLTNPENYAELEAYYGITRIATMVTLSGGSPLNMFGAVIFCRSDKKDINKLNDLKDKSFVAVQKISFGGWQMAWREFIDKGIDPYSDFTQLTFTGFPQDLVVYAVRDGKADAGTIRTGILESMAKEGKISLRDYKILNQQQHEGFPLLHNTRLYPEWAFAKLRNTW